MIHPKAEVHKSVFVPDSSTVWAFAIVGEGTYIDHDTVIGSGVYIGKNCRIGRGVHIQHGVFLPNGSIIYDDVFIGPNCTFTDDKYPRAGNKGYVAQPPVIHKGASIGAGAVILPGVIIGSKSMIAAGAVVTHSVGYGDTVRGVPARKDVYEPTDVRH